MWSFQGCVCMIFSYLMLNHEISIHFVGVHSEPKIFIRPVTYCHVQFVDRDCLDMGPNYNASKVISWVSCNDVPSIAFNFSMNSDSRGS
mmetsp:Transcript_3600/g.7492  ORF Transcript_3600/g.7492 Transcript_3600/m.7492 type:complete len:89 (-) Transcript_3600:434-700(-)